MAPENAAEAARCQVCRCVAATTLNEAVDILCGRADPAPVPSRRAAAPPRPARSERRARPARARRALEIAAAGRHNLLMCGPPGSGKTMLARRLVGILPPPTAAESLEISRVHSAAGLLAPGTRALRRPFRAPHHSASSAALVGGAEPAPRRGDAGPPRRARSWTSCPSSRDRRWRRCGCRWRRAGSRSRGPAGRAVMPSRCIVVARDEPVPVRPSAATPSASAAARRSGWRRTGRGSAGRCSTASTCASRRRGPTRTGSARRAVRPPSPRGWRLPRELLGRRTPPRLSDAARRCSIASCESRRLSGRACARTGRWPRTHRRAGRPAERIEDDHMAEALCPTGGSL